MDTARVGQVQAYYDGGSINHVLLRAGKFDARNLLVIWTVVSPHSQQHGHTHAGSEEAYIVVHGMGRLQMGEEQRLVGQGEMVYVPPGAPHSIANPGDENLVIVSIASPPFPVERLFSGRGRREQAEPEATAEIE